MRSRATAVLAVAVTLAAVSGCGAAKLTTVTADVDLWGGPYNPSTGTETWQGTPAQGAKVTARSSGGRAWTGFTDQSGAAHLQLPPGRYTISAGSCGQDHQVTVEAGKPIAVTIECAVP